MVPFMNLHRKLVIPRSPTIRGEAFKIIREMIISGEISPGTKLSESKLAMELGTSRTPVREALHTLEKENLLESIPRIGYIVKEVTPEEAGEIVDIRIALETLAAKRASQKISAAELKELYDIVKQSEACIRSNDTKGIVALNTKFHEGICKASHSPRILEINLNLRDHMLMLRNRTRIVGHAAMENNEGHRRILKAIEQSDFDAIEETVRSHLEITRTDIARTFGQ
jgi:DNA-binding GntR family transcriptional regulator